MKYHGRNLLSGYAPDTFLKPIMLVSTVFCKLGQERSTAICFGDTLNRFHLMGKVFVAKECYKRAGWGDPRKDVSKFIVIKKHKTWKEAYQYHIKLMGTMNWDSYFALYTKYCPLKLKKILNVD